MKLSGDNNCEHVYLHCKLFVNYVLIHQAFERPIQDLSE